jgi:hypothetical protein
MVSVERMWMSTAGGVLSIIAGIIHLSEWLTIGIVFDRFASDLPELPVASMWVIVLPLVITAIVSIIGGIFAIRKRIWGLALAGSICAISGPITGFLGVTATVLMAISKHEFNH